MSISACIIMKNEVKVVRRMLESIKPYVDEIIIVDTGSTDNSVAIVEQTGVHVHHMKWTDDFSIARNFSVNLAQSEWILWIDCDEELIVPEQYNIKQLISTEGISLIRLPVYNLTSKDRESEFDTYVMSQYRLFKKSSGYKFINAIHEHLDLSSVRNLEEVSLDTNLRITHYGYTDEIVNEKNKSKRNREMIKRELERDNQNPWLHYHLGSEFYRIKEFNDAFNHINISIRKFLEQQQFPPSILYKMKYDILMATSNFNNVIEAIPLALKLYPDYVDLHFYRALALYATQQYKAAIEHFLLCIEMGEKNKGYLTLMGVGSFRSYYYLNLCYQATGNIEQANLYKQKYECSQYDKNME